MTKMYYNFCQVYVALFICVKKTVLGPGMALALCVVEVMR